MNLRIVEIKTIDSRNIVAEFTDKLDIFLNTSNVNITSDIVGISNPEILKINVSDNKLKILVQPLVPFVQYFIEFVSSEVTRFKSQNGTSFLLEDGINNKRLLIGPEDSESPILNYLLDTLKNNIFNLAPGTIVRSILNHQDNILSRALYDIGQAKNDNYLSFTISDEKHVRGIGPKDRLFEEGTYQILKVSKNLTDNVLSVILEFESFPFGIITLLSSEINQEILKAGTAPGTFNNLIINTQNNFVTKLNSLLINYDSGNSYDYPISRFGYQLKDANYDSDFASVLLTLENNQFKLNEEFLKETPLPGAADTIIINYEYKNKSRFINSAVVYTIEAVSREVVAPLLKQFSLEHANILDSANNPASFGAVQFLDPNANPPFSEIHPAFVKELPFKLDGLPAQAGEFTIDYASGKVIVYGENGDGSGNFPPLVSYKYQNILVEDLDYTFDADTNDLAPLRDTSGKHIFINISFNNILSPDIDYIPEIHTEVLDERIENRLTSSISLQTLNTPITNVFRIFNETSGEVYSIQRWNDNTIYFATQVPPLLKQVTREKATFELILNEIILIDSELLNSNSIRILKILMSNNNIMAASEDALGSNYNSSITFSNGILFENELYFDDQQDLNFNIDKLSLNEYTVDYANGVIYVAVSNDQNADLGTVSYKAPIIVTENSNIITVENVYFSLDFSGNNDRKIDYIRTDINQIFPATFERSDEFFFEIPYIVESNSIIVKDDIKEVRNVFDRTDLNQADSPTNFADSATFSANTILLNPVDKQELLEIQSGLVLEPSIVSPGIDLINITRLIRTNDNQELSGTVSGNIITLDGTNSPSIGETVLVMYQISLNGAATPIVDYNRGDYFIDYTYLADQILVSYEYGDNSLNFSQSLALNPGDTYYVTYKAGALRDALLKNFGTLTSIPILQKFDTSLERERYRDALTGALQSFSKGPTIPSIQSLVENITHVKPEIIEAAFINWSLGISRLFFNQIEFSDNIQLQSGKFDQGALVESDGQFIRFPVISNLRLKEGTAELWVLPSWNGLDNDASLQFDLFEDNIDLDLSKIWIGSSSFHPESNPFTIEKNESIGLPSKIYTDVGVFIYYDEHEKRWKLLAKDSTSESHLYSGNIISSGEVYDVKQIPGLGEINDIIRSTGNNIKFEFNLDGYDALSPDGYSDGYDGYMPGFSFDGLSFMADNEHYFIDFGQSTNANRFSLFKDGMGYLNFRIIDKRSRRYQISKDISDWQAGQLYHIALSWILNSADRKDEMHLFIDGQETANILRYGGRPIASQTDRFRTIKPEIVMGTVPLVTITENDLHTQFGSNIVFSDTINFEASGVAVGHTIRINEIGFGDYTINAVNGTKLTLSSTMPATLDDAKFSINPYSVILASEIDLFANIAVSIIHNGEETEIPGLRANLPSYEVSRNVFNQVVFTLLGSAEAGDQIAIRTLGLNHRRARERQYVWSSAFNILRTQMPPPININSVKITPIIIPNFVVGPDSATISGSDFTVIGQAIDMQPSNSIEGRTLSVRVNGNNVNFTNPVSITINGNTTETLIFTTAGTQSTAQKFASLTSFDITITPFYLNKNSISVEISEAYSITESEGNSSFAAIHFSYQIQSGTNLSGDGSDIVIDTEEKFLASQIGQTLIIDSPLSVATSYAIMERISETELRVSPTPATSFTDGLYRIYQIGLGNTGFQNGFFLFEEAGTINPWLLNAGTYEIDYAANLEIQFDPFTTEKVYIGSDINKNKQANAVIDELVFVSEKLTDVRIGESTSDDNITTRFNRLRPHHPIVTTLTYIDFNGKPFVNNSDFWIAFEKLYIQSSNSVNSNFDRSIVITDKPLIVENKGLLSTNNQGCIEFWISPRFDTYNDPNTRFYFDASSSAVETVTSLSRGSVKISGRAQNILSIQLLNDDTTNYATGATLQSDFQTIQLIKALPYQQTPVKVNYLPVGFSGDRISIYKNQFGYLVFNVTIKEVDYQVSQPIFWARDSWHRVKASYQFNSRDNLDFLKLFVDGEINNVITFGSGIIFGTGVVFGETRGDAFLSADLNFKDFINYFAIGSDYASAHLAQARFDNFKLSNNARAPTIVAGQPIDIYYNSNTDTVLPAIPDAFTTYLLNFDTLVTKNEDFTILRNEQFGIFNFDINVFDSFNIVSGSAAVKQILETLIRTLKPAHAKVGINYV